MFAYLYCTLFGELLQPNDDFFMRCRKGVITVYGIFGVISIFSLKCSLASNVLSTDWTVLAILCTVLYYIHFMVCIGSWIYAKITRKCPDWLINLVINMDLCNVILGHFSSPNWNFHAVCLVIEFVAVVIGTSHMKLQVAVSIFAFLINAYDTLGFPSILLPGNYEGTTLPRQITNGVVACLGLFLLYQYQSWTLLL